MLSSNPCQEAHLSQSPPDKSLYFTVYWADSVVMHFSKDCFLEWGVGNHSYNVGYNCGLQATETTVEGCQSLWCHKQFNIVCNFKFLLCSRLELHFWQGILSTWLYLINWEKQTKQWQQKTVICSQSLKKNVVCNFRSLVMCIFFYCCRCISLITKFL